MNESDDLAPARGCLNGVLLGLLFWAFLAMLTAPAWATSPTKQPDPAQSQAQNQSQATEQAQEQANSQSTDAAIAVDSDGPSVGFLLGGGSSGSDSTAACLERRPSWGFGFRGDKTKLNAQCWGEYMRQAEHARELDVARLELERARLELERERLAIERAELELCFECSQQK